MAGGLGVLFGKDPLNLPLEDQISFAAQVIILDHHHLRIHEIHKPDLCCYSRFEKNEHIGRSES